MTPFTDEEAEQIFRENAAFLAAQLGMREEKDPMELRDKQPVLLVTNDNITLGETFLREARTPLYRYATLVVACARPRDVYERQFCRTVDGSWVMEQTTVLVNKDCTIYVGY